jgi:hypothetical protein
MARRVVLSDDFDGTEAEDVKTVYFMVNYEWYEIDLTAANLTKLTKAVKQFTDKARETTPKRVNQNAPVTANTDSDNENARIRLYLKNNGMPDLGERGRIPEDGVTQYNKAVEDGSYDEWFKSFMEVHPMYTKNLPDKE